MHGERTKQRGAALVEYAMIVPLLMLLFFGSLEMFRLVSIQQSLRSGLKQAVPCLSHYRDYAAQVDCDPEARLLSELARNPFTVDVARLSLWPSAQELEGMPYAEVFEVIAEVEVPLGFLYPFEGGPTFTVRESSPTFINSSPEYFEMNVLTPFPVDPGPLPR